MLKLMLVFLFLISCSVSSTSTKILTKNIPSTDKMVLQGTKVRNVNSTVRTEYDLMQRLYDTVWYQTTKEYDDGRLETETELVMFNNNSWLVEREIENGRMEAVERDDYKQVTLVETLTTDLNAVIVSVKEYDGDIEYEGYLLLDQNHLYIVEGDTHAEAKSELQRIIANPNSTRDVEKYLLSTK